MRDESGDIGDTRAAGHPAHQPVPERSRLDSDLEALEAIPQNDLDADALAAEIVEAMSGFEALFEEGTLEEQKEFIRLFVEKIELNAEEKRAVVRIRRFPAPASLVTGNSSFQLVAGVGFEPTTFGLCLPPQLSLPL